MCGFVALIGEVPDLQGSVDRMCDAVHHRGPDDGGSWIWPGHQVALGHRRLSIIDLSPLGHQPMANEDGSLVISYNGEVYNFRDLRTQLLAKGHKFRSQTDTEVVLHAYEEWGEQCASLFNGMWAFVICDTRRHLIFASRDRMGVKPFYYYWDGARLVMASEIKAILASQVIRAAVDPEGLNEYFTFQNIISDRTLFAGIKMLPAGFNLELDLRERRMSTSRYWDLRYEPQDLSEDQFSSMILERFRAAMGRHLISDVEIGATISGGMDSSAITAITTTHFRDLQTFTGYFDTDGIEPTDRCVSEKDDARIIAQMFGTKHHERLISPQDVIDTLPMIVWHLEDPKVGMCYTFYTLAQLVASELKVNLSGSGGDETYAGYPWRYAIIEDKHDPREFDAAYYDYWSRLVKDGDRHRLFSERMLREMDPKTPRKAYESLIRGAEGLSPINKALYFEVKTFLHGMLMVEDKMSMAFSLETRVPYLDNEMVEMTLLMPDALKYRNKISKYMLKRAFEPLLPQEIIHKRKQGFTPPDKTWYRRELREYIRDLLLGPKSCMGEYVNRPYVEETLRRHDEGSDERLIIWSLMFFEGWCRIFLAGRSVPRPFCSEDGRASQKWE